MLYSIFAYDVENSLPLRAEARPGHIARLKEMAEQGRLIWRARTRPSIPKNPATPVSAAA